MSVAAGTDHGAVAACPAEHQQEHAAPRTEACCEMLRLLHPVLGVAAACADLDTWLAVVVGHPGSACMHRRTEVVFPVDVCACGCGCVHVWVRVWAHVTGAIIK